MIGAAPLRVVTGGAYVHDRMVTPMQKSTRPTNAKASMVLTRLPGPVPRIGWWVCGAPPGRQPIYRHSERQAEESLREAQYWRPPVPERGGVG